MSLDVSEAALRFYSQQERQGSALTFIYREDELAVV